MGSDNTVSDSDDDNDDNECVILIFLQLLHQTLGVIWVENLAFRELRNLASEFKKSEYHDVHKESFSTIRA
jgi:hypothetical protein